MEEERNYTVYMHVNKENDKTYIGITCQKPEKRWGSNGVHYQDQPFGRAINKYGWNNFEHIILFENKTKDEAEFLEKLYIKIFLSNKRKFGYNLQDGGNINGLHSEESKQKMSEAHKGKKFSKEHREKMSKTRLHKPMVNSDRIICDGKIFVSQSEFADSYGIKKTSVYNWLNGKTKMPQKFIDMGLKYADKETTLKNEEDKSKRKVTYDGKIFNSIKECGEYCGESPNSLWSWINGINMIPEEFYNKNLNYADIDEKEDKRRLRTERSRKDNPNSKKVICDGVLYDSLTDMSETYDVNINTVSNWLVGDNKMPKKFADLGLRFLDDNTTVYEIQEKSPKRKIIFDNIIFNSISECAKNIILTEGQ